MRTRRSQNDRGRDLYSRIPGCCHPGNCLDLVRACRIETTLPARKACQTRLFHEIQVSPRTAYPAEPAPFLDCLHCRLREYQGPSLKAFQTARVKSCFSPNRNRPRKAGSCFFFSLQTIASRADKRFCLSGDPLLGASTSLEKSYNGNARTFTGRDSRCTSFPI